jgi:hypothetical protein
MASGSVNVSVYDSVVTLRLASQVPDMGGVMYPGPGGLPVPVLLWVLSTCFILGIRT